jgi:hypothetical protein
MARATTKKERGVVVGLIKDVFFGITVRNTIRRLNFEAQIIKTLDELPSAIAVYEPDLLIVDLNLMGDDPTQWDPIKDVLGGGTRVLAFGPHMDVEKMRAAKEAGVTRTISNSQFHRNMAELIERYALPQEPVV